MESMQHRVMEFHRKYGHPIAGLINARLVGFNPVFRASLHSEEAVTEFLRACGQEETRDSKRLIADALGDALYVILGTAVEYGIDMEPVFGAIHVSNMTKSTEKDSTGKTVKGPDYVPPDIESALILSTLSFGEPPPSVAEDNTYYGPNNGDGPPWRSRIDNNPNQNLVDNP